jgi:hypothetical protein
MSRDDDFWDDLLGHVRQQVLVPVVGPNLAVIENGAETQPLTRLIGDRLSARYNLSMPEGPATMDEAVAVFLRERGRDEAERLYRVINDILTELDPVPGAPLYDLAAIEDLRFFVSTTPDRLLAEAIDEVRFHGQPATREVPFSPNQSTAEQSRNARPPTATEVVVLGLFGRAASTPQYAIHEEDRLEWLHALLSDEASLPEWLAYRLKHQPLLYVGWDIPDWIGRFLLRMSSNTRLSLESKQFFFVGPATSHEPALEKFFATYCRKAQVQRLEMTPGEFVAQLRDRWEKQRLARRRGSPAHPGAEPSADSPGIFISYLREDVAAARLLRDEIAALGGDVWLDERRLLPGDPWEHDILTAIRRKVRLFVPILSAHTEQEEEGYVFREWAEAAERSRAIPRRRFIVPVVIDENYAGDPERYRQVPDEFLRLHFGRAPAGAPDADLLATLTAEIRAMRRTSAA